MGVFLVRNIFLTYLCIMNVNNEPLVLRVWLALIYAVGIAAFVGIDIGLMMLINMIWTEI